MANEILGNPRGIQISPAGSTNKYFIILMDMPVSLVIPPPQLVFSFTGATVNSNGVVTLNYTCNHSAPPANGPVTTCLVDVFTQQNVNPSMVSITFREATVMTGSINNVQLSIPVPDPGNVTSFVIQSATNTSSYFACGLANVSNPSNPSINPLTGVPITLEFPGGGTNTYLEMTPVDNANGSTLPMMCKPSTYMQFAGIIFPASDGAAFDYDNAFVEGTTQTKAINIVPVGNQLINYYIFTIDLLDSTQNPIAEPTFTRLPVTGSADAAVLNFQYNGVFNTTGNFFKTFLVDINTDPVVIDGGPATPKFVAVRDTSGKVKKGDLNKMKKTILFGDEDAFVARGAQSDDEPAVGFCRPLVIRSIINPDDYFVAALIKSEDNVKDHATFGQLVSGAQRTLVYEFESPASRSLPSATAVLACIHSAKDEYSSVTGPLAAGAANIDYSNNSVVLNYATGDENASALSVSL